MNQQSWFSSTDPKQLAEYLFSQSSHRKLRLWGCACWRELLPTFRNSQFADALVIFEDVAEGKLNRKDYSDVLSELQWQRDDDVTPGYHQAVAGVVHSQWIEMNAGYEGHFSLGLLHLAFAEAYNRFPSAAPSGPTDPPTDPDWQSVYSKSRQRQADFARDIFGNPFNDLAVDPSWLTPRVTSLAGEIYQGRTFDLLPILSEELQAAGCKDQELLIHCRNSGLHVRGCWALDLLLGNP